MLDDQVKVVTQFIMAFYDLYARNREKVENSLTFFRVVSLYRQLRWIQNSISKNAYHQSIRELRFIVESIVQAYYVDERHPEIGMQCKLEIVKEIDERRFGSRLIEKTNLKSNKQDLTDLYHELSSYVHSTYEELTSSLLSVTDKIAPVKFEENNELMKLCVDFTNRTIDVVFFVTLTLFPEIFGPDTKLKKIRTSFPGSVKELGCKLTLKMLNGSS